MYRAGLIVVLALALGACKGERRTPAGASRPLTADAATRAEADALWALAPKDARFGAVVTGRALVLVDRGAAAVRAIAARLPGVGAFVADLDAAMGALRGTAASYADAGLALERGAALFRVGPGWIAILPVADRAKFVATHAGTSDGGVDHVIGAACKPIDKVYACSSEGAELVLGGGDLGTHAGVSTLRGDAEMVGVLPPLPASVPFQPAGPLSAVINLRPGEFVLHAHVPGRSSGPLAALAASPPAHIDIDRAGGFVVAPIGVVAATIPSTASGPIDIRALLASLAGPLQLVVPVGASDVDLRAPLADPGPVTQLVSSCPSFGIPTARTPAGACRIGPVPPTGATLELWVDGKELRGSKAKGPAPRSIGTSPPSAAGRELAGYTAALWGHGTSIGTVPPGLPPDAGQVVTALGYLSEIGMGARFAPDGVSLLVTLRTIHANPDDVVAKLEAALASKADRAAVTALAKGHPGTPLAADVAAGPVSLFAPVGAVGVVAAMAIPVFVDYTKASKRNEAPATPSSID